MNSIPHLGTVQLPAVKIKKDRYKDTGLIVVQQPATLHLLPILPCPDAQTKLETSTDTAIDKSSREETQEEVNAWFDVALAQAQLDQSMNLPVSSPSQSQSNSFAQHQGQDVMQTDLLDF